MTGFKRTTRPGEYVIVFARAHLCLSAFCPQAVGLLPWLCPGPRKGSALDTPKGLVPLESRASLIIFVRGLMVKFLHPIDKSAHF